MGVNTESADSPASDRLLDEAARSNVVVEAQWPQLRSSIEEKIQEHITSLRTHDDALYDKAADPPWPMDQEAIHQATERLKSLLAQFRTQAPFTVQRLAELALSPRPHYISLPKYLRALERCLLVSSPLAAFPATPTPAVSYMNGGPVRSRSNSASTPLLSPIPFLANRNNTEAPGSPRVDELDLGEGTAQMAAEPIALTSTSIAEGVKSPPLVQDASKADVEAQKAAEKMDEVKTLLADDADTA